MARAVSEYGGLDAAFNNAGLLAPTALLAEQTEEDWHRILNVDLTGIFLCFKHELAHMAKAGRGAIVNTSSVAGLRADPGMAPYVRPEPTGWDLARQSRSQADPPDNPGSTQRLRPSS